MIRHPADDYFRRNLAWAVHNVRHGCRALAHRDIECARVHLHLARVWLNRGWWSQPCIGHRRDRLVLVQRIVDRLSGLVSLAEGLIEGRTAGNVPGNHERTGT